MTRPLHQLYAAMVVLLASAAILLVVPSVYASSHTTDKLLRTMTNLNQDNAGLFLNSSKDIQARQEVTNNLLAEINQHENLNGELLNNIASYVHILELSQTKSINGTALNVTK